MHRATAGGKRPRPYAQKNIASKMPKQSYQDSEEEDEEDDDEEEEEEEELSEEEEPKARPRAQKRLVRPEVEEEEEDDEEEEEADEEADEEEEEEEEESHQKKLKRKDRATKRPRNMFVDVEAEVDEDEEEEEEDYDDEDDDHERLEAMQLEKQLQEEQEDETAASAPHRDLLRKAREEEELDVRAEAERLKAVYGKQESRSYRQQDESRLPAHLMTPRMTDPKLFLVRCQPGREQTLVCNLMRKYLDSEYTDTPLLLFSVMTRPNLKGYIYVEAHKQAHVVTAVTGMRGIYASNRISLVPLHEMMDVVHISAPKKEGFPLKSYVRIKQARSRYNGDLGQVTSLVEGEQGVVVRLLPRLEKEQRLFDAKQYPNAKRIQGQTYELGQDTFVNGFLHKYYRPEQLERVTRPELSELQLLSQGELNLVQTAVEDGTFSVGDVVQVLQGEFQAMQGLVQSVEQENLVLSFTGLEESVSLPKSHVRKYFQVGDAIKVVRGRHQGETGLVVRVQGDRLILFGNQSMQELEVFLKDVSHASSTVAVTVSSTSNKKENLTQTKPFALLDAVQCDAQSVGIVLQWTENDQILVLDHQSQLRTLPLSQLTAYRPPRHTAVTLDQRQQALKVGDAVSLYLQGVLHPTAKILAIFKGWVFVHVRDLEQQAHRGVFVVRGNAIQLSTSIQMSNPFAIGHGNNTPSNNTPVNNNSFTATSSPSAGLNASRLISQTVTITQGPFKGYLGIVKDCNNAGLARVELHTKNKTISIESSKLRIKSLGSSGSTDTTQGFQLMAGAMTPAVNAGSSGGMTPFIHAGSRTPAWDAGSKTPAWDAGSRTPAWDAGSKTPAWDAGSRTPAWDAGSKTPAWDAGSRTPAWDASNKTPSYDASRTPAWDAGSRTPAWDASNKTPSYDASKQTSGWDARTTATTASSGWDAKPSQPSSQWDSARFAAPSGTPHYGQVTTPGYNAQTPFPNSNNNVTTPAATTPGYNVMSTPGYNVPTPAPNTAMGVHHTPGYHTPAASASVSVPASMSHADESIHFVPGIEVTLTAGIYQGSRAVIRQVHSNECQIMLLDSRQMLTLPAGQLQLVAPLKKDAVVVLAGELRGERGVLFGLDGQDGIVRLEQAAGSDFKIFNIAWVGKVHQEK